MLFIRTRIQCSIRAVNLTWAQQTGTPRSPPQAEEVSLCRHQLRPQRNWRVRAGRRQTDNMSHRDPDRQLTSVMCYQGLSCVDTFLAPA